MPGIAECVDYLGEREHGAGGAGVEVRGETVLVEMKVERQALAPGPSDAGASSSP